MNYCKHCLYPDTKPGLTFDDNGVCSACIAYYERTTIPWAKRENQFIELFEDVKDKFIYDCIVPVSGGKDSHYQVIKALEYGLKPLAVTATTDDLSTIGRRNLNNISKLGVDHIEVSVNSQIRRKIAAYALREVGDISWAEHVTIFTIPVKEAIIRNIPYIIWGENPQNEYGGPNSDVQSKNLLERDWLQEFGGLNGLRVTDIIEQEIATKEEMWQYIMPEKIEGRFYPKGIFLGHFFAWNGEENAEIASKYGFERSPLPVEGCGKDYENLDNYQTGIHDYFKWLKFGFGRATDVACNDIRRGRITRQEGKEYVLEFDGRYPTTYLGKSLEDILKRIDVSVEEFLELADKFTNPNLFHPRLKNRASPKLKWHILEV